MMYRNTSSTTTKLTILWRRIRFSSSPLISPRQPSLDSALSPHLQSLLHSLSSPPSTKPPFSFPPYNNIPLEHFNLSRTFCAANPHPGDGTNHCCWNCNSPDTFLVCGSCRSIQPLDSSIDYFRIFGLERSYDIEERSLEGKYKNWQKQLHPDLVHSKSEREREYAAEQSARVIDAYKTLGSPLTRAIYLLKLQGVHVDEEQTVSDPELLSEILEIRESVVDAADSQALNQIQKQVQEKIQQCSQSFATAYKSQDIEQELNSVRRMTYYKRACEEIVKRL